MSTAEQRRAERRERRRRRLRRERLAVASLVTVVLALIGTAAGFSSLRSGGGPPAVSTQTLTIPPERPSLDVAAVGDMTFGTNGSYPPGGSSSLFEQVRRSLRSDLTIGNLETTLGTNGAEKCSARSTACYRFQAPPSTAVALHGAGFRAVNVANNHANDAGYEGQVETDAALDAAHVAYFGRPGQITYVKQKGVRVALIGFAPYPFDQSLLDIAGGVALIRTADAHADLVVVMLHAGAEGSAHEHVRPGMEDYLGEQRGDPIRFAHAAVDAGADLVLASGPHVLRAMELYRGRLITYSLGNFTGYRTLGISGDSGVSAILHVRVNPDGTFGSGRLVPIVLVGDGTPVPDPGKRSFDLVNRLGKSDLAARAMRVKADGTLVAP